MTPNLAVIEINRPDHRMPRLWLPLFLLWIPAILLSPIIFVTIVGVCLGFRINPWRAIAVFWQIICSLPGIEVRVVADYGTRVQVRIL